MKHNTHQRLSAILFPSYRRRVLGMLFLRPQECLHGREIARRTGLPAGTLTRELRRLAEVGLLNRERRGNQLIYSANRECLIFDELAGILRKIAGSADRIAAALEPLADRIKVAFISAVGGNRGNHVEVLLIGSIDPTTVSGCLEPLQRELARTITARVFSAREWPVKARTRVLVEVLARKKIFLVGDEHELAQLGRRRAS